MDAVSIPGFRVLGLRARACLPCQSSYSRDLVSRLTTRDHPVTLESHRRTEA